MLEVDNILTVLNNLFKSEISSILIGIITPYKSQITKIVKRVSNKWNDSNIEIGSVDSFQGREKDYIIFRGVRSNDDNKIGFLSNYRRLNVAITNAKFGQTIQQFKIINN
ncbi:hypothetical protein A3Q56_05472 [Intoshia linei]|uniref:DNA2/NAM7 helicase-like C-terminal domain-containing protein n=1 Tax=Intoshia linei TaxID=1819745 RepID=A0A177AZK1_9BILA|nr:hypothetical protein A3Q56_05472 [Intoshia linei]